MKEKIKNRMRRFAEAGRQAKTQAQQLMKSPANRKGVILLIVLALAAGWLLANIFQAPAKRPLSAGQTVHEHHDHGEEETRFWTCAMHPQIRMQHPGRCPICGMDLVPVTEARHPGIPSARRFVMSREAAKLAGIQTSPVERRPVSTEVRLAGKVEYDESRTAFITAWTGGRMDRLYVDQTGIPVRKGDHLALIYSPELLSAQEEYLQALEGMQKVKDSHLDIIRSTSEMTVENARQKLKLLGITDAQIKELEEKKQISEHMTLYSPTSGIVVEKKVQEGDYVQTGTRIFSIVDLLEVWIRLDAYEADLKWLRYGQEVSFQAQAYPGEIFHGRISFIEPVLDETTRTVKVRINVANPEQRLKPGMFVRAVVRAHIGAEGRVVDMDLTGKWICPMHPHILEEKAEECPICGMDLVPTEEMGYAPVTDTGLPLVVPASAVLRTGKRAVVYVEVPGAETPAFEGREIVLGPRAGDYYLVKTGLFEGERVVTHGNFKIDSALQIQAKPSMMSPEGSTPGHMHPHDHSLQHEGSHGREAAESETAAAVVPKEFLQQLQGVYAAFFDMQQALAQDELTGAKNAAAKMQTALTKPDMELLAGEAQSGRQTTSSSPAVPEHEARMHAQWMDLGARIQNSLVLAAEAPDLEMLRNEILKDLADQMLSLQRHFGHAGTETHYEAYCPMALGGKGVSWLQKEKEIKNPFFGKSMLRCGEIRKEFPPAHHEAADGEQHRHVH